MRGCQFGFAEVPLISLDIGFRRRLQMASRQPDEVVSTRTAKRLDHLQMIKAGAIERFGKGIGIGANAVNLLGQQVDGFDQAGIAAEAVQFPMKTEVAVKHSEQVTGGNG